MIVTGMSPVQIYVKNIYLKFFWILSVCFSFIRADGCKKVKVSNSLYHETKEGTYERMSSYCTDREMYRQSGGTNYLFYMETSGGWRGWMIGNSRCTNRIGIAVETESRYPENVNETWEETYGGEWRYNRLLTVKCHYISSGTIVGIVIVVLLVISLAVFLGMRYRRMKQKRRMLPQSVRRTQVRTVSENSSARRVPNPHLSNNGRQYPPNQQSAQRPRYPPPPMMRPGFGHGPMMTPPRYGAGAMMTPYDGRPALPPSQRFAGPMAPPYPGFPGSTTSPYPVPRGPPPPYYPPPGAPFADQSQAQLASRQDERQREQQRMQPQGQGQAEREEKADQQMQMQTLHSVTHGGHPGAIRGDATAAVAD